MRFGIYPGPHFCINNFMKFTEYLEETIKAGHKNEELWLDYLKEKIFQIR